MTKKSKPTSKCLTPACHLGNYARGLCRWHYQIAWKLIEARETTWAKLIETGKARESKPERFEREAARMKAIEI